MGLNIHLTTIATCFIVFSSLLNNVFATTGANQYIAVTGSTTGTNIQTKARPFRRNILDLQKDGPSWDLYIQCLTTMQNIDESDPLSWFQIAGIHGRPYTTWNNIGPVPNYSYGGYCTHSSVLFTTWHRPYIALFEQVLTQCAQNLSKQYTGSNSFIYQAAADKLRIPYWDWATDPRMPDVVSVATVQINTPTGSANVRNPLFSYRFKRFPLDTTQFPLTSMSVFPQTVRSPQTNTADAVSNVAGINSLLLGGNIMQRTYDALTKGNGLFDSFSSGASPGPSIENVHNNIHSYTGGNGHMTFLDYSGFDPLFWLHHVQVDRLFNMWQAINPTSQMIPALEPGTYAIPHNNLNTPLTPLYPFTSNTAGQLITVASSLSPVKFNYAYPEVEDWHQTPDQLKTNVTAQINQMYDPNGLWATTKPLPALEKKNTLRAGAVTREWSVAVKVAKFDLDGGMFRIRIFLGDIPADTKDWALSKSLIGTMSVMPPHYSGPKPFPNITLFDEWSLTKAVIAAGHDPTSTQDITEYLTKNLDWRVQKLDGTVVNLAELQSLQVSVFDQKLQLPTHVTELPKFGEEHNYHVDVTKHKPGGMTTASGTKV